MKLKYKTFYSKSQKSLTKKTDKLKNNNFKIIHCTVFMYNGKLIYYGIAIKEVE